MEGAVREAGSESPKREAGEEADISALQTRKGRRTEDGTFAEERTKDTEKSGSVGKCPEGFSGTSVTEDFSRPRDMFRQIRNSK